MVTGLLIITFIIQVHLRKTTVFTETVDCYSHYNSVYVCSLTDGFILMMVHCSSQLNKSLIITQSSLMVYQHRCRNQFRQKEGSHFHTSHGGWVPCYYTLVWFIVEYPVAIGYKHAV